MARTNYVVNRRGVISEDMQTATVDGYTFQLKEIVPYRNTRGNLDFAEITGFKKIESGTVWFYGKSQKTNADVYYGLHCSLEIQREIDG